MTTKNGVLSASGEVSTDGSNGDQFFTATFGGSATGVQEFTPFMVRPTKPVAGAPSLPFQAYADGHARPGQEPPGFIPPDNEAAVVGNDPAFVDRFAAMSIPSHVQNSGTPLKGRNPGASEFIPKSSGSPAGTGLTHSASTPSFTSYAQMGTMGNTLVNPQLSQATLSAGTSPLASPGMSPQGSPLINRRREHSPVPNLHIDAANGSTLQENVGGTTYFYNQEEVKATNQGMILPNFTVYPGVLPHMAHMKPKSNLPSFFMPDEIKAEMLNRHAVTLAQIDPEQNPDIPQEVDAYRCLCPLEPPPPNPLHKSSTFGYPTTCYKATNTKDGLVYCLRRIHGFRLVNTKCMALIDIWKKIQHSNIVQLRQVFTTKAFGDHSMVFVYDYHACSETLMARHFQNAPQLNGYANPYNVDGAARPYTAGKANGPRQHAGLLPESLIWSYIVQLSSALRTIHAYGLACRVMDPTKVLLTDKSRIRLNCVGIFDVLSFDASQANPLAMMPHYQQEDLMSLGKVVLALACNSVLGIQREHLQTSMDLVTRNYSSDLKNLILYLLTNQNRLRSVNDIMPMIGARFYTQLDAAQLRSDVLENELAKEVENGRQFRLLSKLGVLNERPEFHMDPAWSETGDRYILKLFRDYLFHQVDENGAPWVDMAHIVQCLNKLDAGSSEKICLMSRDEQSVLVVSYAELKQCFTAAFSEILQASSQSSSMGFS